MRNTSFIQKPAILAAAVVLLTGAAMSSAMAQATTPPTTPATTTTPAAPATPPPNYKIQWNGLLDGYYLYDFRNIHSSGLTDGNILPGDNSYAVRVNSPTLALAELNVFETAKPGGLGFHATFQAGDDTDVDHLSLAGANSQEARYKSVQQLYGTYLFGASGAGMDFGEFYTPYGYEVVEANGDYNYTRSLPFFFLPVYHVGIRAYTPNMKGFTLTGWVVNALYNTTTAGVSDDNDEKDFIGQINYTDPKGKWDIITTDGGGNDKFNPDFESDSHKNSNIFLSDNDFTYNFTSTVLGGLNYEYGKFDQGAHDDSFGDFGTSDTTENGYAVYLKDQFTPKEAIAARWSEEQVSFSSDNDENDVKPNEFTVTYEYKVSSNFTGRLEYRHDSVNNNQDYIGFANTDGNAFTMAGGPAETSQDMVIAAGLFSFP